MGNRPRRTQSSRPVGPQGRRKAGAAGGASGRFVLRIEPGLHESLRSRARTAGVSLNDYCAGRLASLQPSPVGDVDVASALGRAVRLFGEQVLGLVVFGSWARGEEADGSDVDLLVVVDAAVPITRSLYRRWDEEPVGWDGRAVEPHFVHVPDREAVSGGVWAEAALDGIVVSDRDRRISSALGLIRRHVLSGRLARRTAHGQPYWTEVA